MNTRLYILVENFSNSSREEFFEKELPILVNHFDKIIIIPLYRGNDNLKYNHPKIEVKQFNAFSSCNRLLVVFRYFFLGLKMFGYEIMHTHNRRFYFKNIKELINLLIFRISAAEKFKDEFQTDNSVFYSYWFNQWTFILSICKTWNPKLKVVSRVHGSDYKEEQTQKILPFRYFQLNKINNIVPVSEYAKNYLINKFKTKSTKINICRLGLSEVFKLSPINSNELVLVSCSSLIPLKRVHLISEILKHVTIPATWVHFGNGKEMETLVKYNSKLPNNINVVLMGYVENKKFIDYLENNPVSFFINVSENEGIPVTLMEAANCGIPLIGTKTCGVPEIVTKETGTLFNVNFEPKEIATFIEKSHLLKNIYKEDYRMKIQEFCTNNFSAQTNYTKLANYLSKLN